ncbi:hypothetical protein OAU50_00375 [Planctomycetota bacterium]|nr:hypothetical protein [Planctomycetota bacterium]
MNTNVKIDEQDQEVLNELITCARGIVATHTRELTEREQRHREAKRPPEKRQVSPSVIRGFLSLVPKLLEMRRALRNMPPLKRITVKAKKSSNQRETLNFANVNNAVSPAL